MSKRVVITGLGVISSIGIGKDIFWQGLLEGKSGISPVIAFDTANYFTHSGGEVKNFRPEEYISKEKAGCLSRASQMAFSAATLAVQDARLCQDEIARLRAGACVGVTSGPVQAIEHINDARVKNQELDQSLLRQIPVNTAAAVISREFNLKGPNYVFSTACAAGNYAIGYGYDLIRLNRADIMLVGGADAFSRISFTGFNQFSAVAPEKCQPFDKNRKGMMVAEGAGVLLLESLENALTRKVSAYAEILGYGLSCDAFHMTNSSVDGITTCMQKALRHADITIDDVDYISAHGTGTPTNDRNECAAIRQIFAERCKKIPISSIKSMIGHAMGAASALEAVACALTVKNDLLPPTINYETRDPDCDIDCVPNQSRKHVVNIALNNSYAFGGNNACLILKKIQ